MFPCKLARMCHTKGVGTYNYTFKSVVFESVQAKSVKIKKSSEALGWPKKVFVRRFENDTFESVEIESVVVSAHPLCDESHLGETPWFIYLQQIEPGLTE